MEAQLSNMRLRNPLQDSFEGDKGVIHYTQLQLERVDPDTQRIEIVRVSVRQNESNKVLERIKPLVGKYVSVMVEASAQDKNRMRYQLVGDIKLVPAPAESIKQAS